MIATGENLQGADLRETNLGDASLSGADLERARYDDATKWREGFDPRSAKAVLVTS